MQRSALQLDAEVLLFVIVHCFVFVFPFYRNENCNCRQIGCIDGDIGINRAHLQVTNIIRCIFFVNGGKRNL